MPHAVFTRDRGGGGRLMRVGIIALQHESNTFASQPTEFAEFKRDHVLTGDSIRDWMSAAHHEVGGFFEGLNETGVTAVPIFSARALPGGALPRDTFDRLVDMMLAALDD